MKHQVAIVLDEAALVALWQVVVDGDGASAIAFLRDYVLPQVPVRGVAPCDSSRLNPYLLRAPAGQGKPGLEQKKRQAVRSGHSCGGAGVDSGPDHEAESE